MARFAFGPLLDAVELNGFLGFLYGPCERSAWLRGFGIGIGFDRVHEQLRGVVVLVGPFHFLQSFFEMLVTVEIDIIAGDKSLIVA